jgi:uncharacterized membrane protein YgcG
MPKSLRWIVVLGAVVVLLHGSATAKTQKRNYNLNCGLIGSFARYPQHNTLCKWQVFCSDPKTCIRKLAIQQKSLEAIVLPEEVETPVSPEAPPATRLGVNVGVQGSVSAGDVNASGSVSAGASADSGGGVSGGGNAGASVGGTGGGLGIGGL